MVGRGVVGGVLLMVMVGCGVLLFTARVSAECGQYSRCMDCITQDPSCAWCNDINVLLAFRDNSASSNPAQLCGTLQELQDLNCRNIINPVTSVANQTATPRPQSTPHVSPTSATISVRPGQPATFDITVAPPQSSAVDMYLLMDLSLTMQQNVVRLRDLAADLVGRMQNATSDFRIGFGSFIDKTVPPFADKFTRDFPCASDTSGRVELDDCEAVYSYRHVLDFTSNVTVLETALGSTKLSSSPDHPESLLDAMLQSALCEAELGWRPRGESQRIIVVFTDGDYHYALDGKVGGILSQPSAMVCRLDPETHEYTQSHLFDYPSANLISEVLNDNLITPIFAVPSTVRSVYDGLVAAIRSATVETLSTNPMAILDLIENQYRILSGTVVPSLTDDGFGGDLNITILPSNNCSPGTLRNDSVDVCTDINFPNSVTYTVQVSAAPSACQRTQPIQTQVQFIRFGAVNLSISLQCDCDCGQLAVANSMICMNRGTLECSTCICNDPQIGGAVCECPRTLGAQADVGCVDPQDPEGRVCNGQGSCNCGRCQCNPIADDSLLSYQGSYCQFDPLNCPQARDQDGVFQPCAGNGECTNSRCECMDGFTGGACDCPTNTSTCRPEGSEEGVALCSGVGDCICGQCICSNYSVNFGQFCEQCQPCRVACSMVSPCVQCMVMEGAECREDLRCRERLVVNGTTDLASTEGMKICSLREGSCEVRYYLSTDAQGNEETIQIFMDPAQSSLVTLGQGSSSCNPPTPIWPIFVGIILGTIFIGILVIILWRCFTYLGEYLEFQQWKKSVEDNTERSGENPLFVDPTSEYSNPRYRPVPM